MSINSRGIAALGAIVVIGAATVGFSVAHATGVEKPVNRMVTLVAGTGSINSEPTCWNDGKPLDEAAQQACQTKVGKLQKSGKLPTIEVNNGDRVGVGVDPDIAKRGWGAYTDAGSQTPAFIATPRKNSTYSGSVAAPTVLKSGEKDTLVTVYEADVKNQEIYGVWYFVLRNTDV
ncbi:hypothetical protein ACIQGZ_27135 [Streptomyces sp. NPDC092296]|uniref:hypothetical protein n=1 Tax=Streptomyces sp. NPDC092296 TaxID=3366012 RepID=UPI0038258033